MSLIHTPGSYTSDHSAGRALPSSWVSYTRLAVIHQTTALGVPYLHRESHTRAWQLYIRPQHWACLTFTVSLIHAPGSYTSDHSAGRALPSPWVSYTRLAVIHQTTALGVPYLHRESHTRAWQLYIRPQHWACLTFTVSLIHAPGSYTSDHSAGRALPSPWVSYTRLAVIHQTTALGVPYHHRESHTRAWQLYIRPQRWACLTFTMSLIHAPGSYTSDHSAGRALPSPWVSYTRLAVIHQTTALGVPYLHHESHTRAWQLYIRPQRWACLTFTVSLTHAPGSYTSDHSAGRALPSPWVSYTRLAVIHQTTALGVPYLHHESYTRAWQLYIRPQRWACLTFTVSLLHAPGSYTLDHSAGRALPSPWVSYRRLAVIHQTTALGVPYLHRESHTRAWQLYIRPQRWACLTVTVSLLHQTTALPTPESLTHAWACLTFTVSLIHAPGSYTSDHSTGRALPSPWVSYTRLAVIHQTTALGVPYLHHESHTRAWQLYIRPQRWGMPYLHHESHTRAWQLYIRPQRWACLTFTMSLLHAPGSYTSDHSAGRALPSPWVSYTRLAVIHQTTALGVPALPSPWVSYTRLAVIHQTTALGVPYLHRESHTGAWQLYIRPPRWACLTFTMSLIHTPGSYTSDHSAGRALPSPWVSYTRLAVIHQTTALGVPYLHRESHTRAWQLYIRPQHWACLTFTVSLIHAPGSYTSDHSAGRALPSPWVSYTRGSYTSDHSTGRALPSPWVSYTRLAVIHQTTALGVPYLHRESHTRAWQLYIRPQRWACLTFTVSLIHTPGSYTSDHSAGRALPSPWVSYTRLAVIHQTTALGVPYLHRESHTRAWQLYIRPQRWACLTFTVSLIHAPGSYTSDHSAGRALPSPWVSYTRLAVIHQTTALGVPYLHRESHTHAWQLYIRPQRWACLTFTVSLIHTPGSYTSDHSAGRALPSPWVSYTRLAVIHQTTALGVPYLHRESHTRAWQLYIRPQRWACLTFTVSLIHAPGSYTSDHSAGRALPSPWVSYRRLAVIHQTTALGCLTFTVSLTHAPGGYTADHSAGRALPSPWVSYTRLAVIHQTTALGVPYLHRESHTRAWQLYIRPQRWACLTFTVSLIHAPGSYTSDHSAGRALPSPWVSYTRLAVIHQTTALGVPYLHHESHTRAWQLYIRPQRWACLTFTVSLIHAPGSYTSDHSAGRALPSPWVSYTRLAVIHQTTALGVPYLHHESHTGAWQLYIRPQRWACLTFTVSLTHAPGGYTADHSAGRALPSPWVSYTRLAVIHQTTALGVPYLHRESHTRAWQLYIRPQRWACLTFTVSLIHAPGSYTSDHSAGRALPSPWVSYTRLAVIHQTTALGVPYLHRESHTRAWQLYIRPQRWACLTFTMSLIQAPGSYTSDHSAGHALPSPWVLHTRLAVIQQTTALGVPYLHHESLTHAWQLYIRPPRWACLTFGRLQPGMLGKSWCSLW